MTEQYIDIVFDGPPSSHSERGRFVEVENEEGSGIGTGEWLEDHQGWWRLRLKVKPGLNALAAKLTSSGATRIISTLKSDREVRQEVHSLASSLMVLQHNGYDIEQLMQQYLREIR